MKSPSKLDVAVLLIFFTRTETLSRTFDAIKKARPSKLFLYQDGPRNPEEAKKIEAAKQIVDDSQIDWECEVERNYHEENSGAWASNYAAHQWAFSLADKCIVLEDDSTPVVSFFTFCKEMLDQYENDKRITMISGFNFEGITCNVPYSYFFTTVFSIWGWASWHRVVSNWEFGYPVMDDNFNKQQLEQLVKQHNGRKEMLKKLTKHHDAGEPIYETLFWSYNMLNSGLTIMPTRNMITNSGISEESAHFQVQYKTLPSSTKRLMTMKNYEMYFPLRHPKYVIENVEYGQRIARLMAWGHPWIKVKRSVEELFLNLRYGNFKRIKQALVHRVKKLLGNYNYV